jgi:SAM-dependent methyltransferase
MNEKMKILDLGCGDRKFSGSIGVDFDKNCNPDVLWDLNKTPYPFDDNSFDMIVTTEVLEHLKDPRAFIGEIKRILNENGILILTTNNKDSLINRLFHTYEVKNHVSLQSIDSLRKIVFSEFKIIEFRCLAFNNQERTDLKYRFFAKLRTILHILLPQALQERMVIVAMKSKTVSEGSERGNSKEDIRQSTDVTTPNEVSMGTREPHFGQINTIFT